MAATLQAYISSHYGHSGLKFSHNVKTATTLSPRARLGLLTSLGARAMRSPHDLRSPINRENCENSCTILPFLILYTVTVILYGTEILY